MKKLLLFLSLVGFSVCADNYDQIRFTLLNVSTSSTPTVATNATRIDGRVMGIYITKSVTDSVAIVVKTVQVPYKFERTIYSASPVVTNALAYPSVLWSSNGTVTATAVGFPLVQDYLQVTAASALRTNQNIDVLIDVERQ